MNKLMKKKKKGFTLIELIAVIAILAVLAVVAVPRVITYVDKSKKVAVQTEASTIYNAAEAAYNDGKLQVSKTEQGKDPVQVAAKSNDFDTLQISEVVAKLKNENLLNNAEDSNISKLGAAKKLNDLKTIMNADVNSLDVDSQGVLQKVPGTESTTGQQTK